MHDIDNINSILNAVNEINSKQKNKNKSNTPIKSFTPELTHNIKISPDVDRLILEAEEYKKKESKSQQVNLIQDKIDTSKSPKQNKTFKDTQNLIIDELYSRFTKKIKKNTLKVIFNLHLKIKDLEIRLENSQKKKKLPIDKKKITIKHQSVNILNNKDILREDVVNSLLIQDTTIDMLNKKIINFKNKEESLHFQIIDLEQDKTLLLNKVKEFDKLKAYTNKINDTKKNLKSVYKQVEIQKKNFVELKNRSTKAELDSSLFKENYENLVVENNEIKKRLLITKEQIAVNDTNKQDLLLSINKLNEILAKTNIAAKISPLNLPIEENFFKEKKTKITE